ncbi:hypothetical protein BD410DRAFT_831408 [Rickenella mellea]|uniref:BTB domain-containing protein n=1 Tax=Rickenella mellea TaxID=50990 RepID=A0A4Y7PS52_9AGAM|nr:hypothetical protein BD410DRAFT_831408 [Rickenella mellea]
MEIRHDSASIGKHHETLYFPAGDLVLAASLKNPGHADGSVLFRVHKFMLAHHSPIFNDMFALPPVDTIETYDGANLVHMPDSAEDLEGLLRVLRCLPYNRRDFDESYFLCGVLELAIKYEIDSIRDRIVGQLKAEWPADLEAWDQLEDRRQAIWKAGDSDAAAELLPEPVLSIQLARQCDARDVLLGAFYQLSWLSAWDIWDCASPDDDATFNPKARWNLLDSRDLLRIIRAREVLSFRTKADPVKMHFLGKRCSESESCNRTFRLIWEDMSSEICRTRDPLEALRILQRPSSPYTSMLCLSCCIHEKTFLRNMRKKMWDNLLSTIISIPIS